MVEDGISVIVLTKDRPDLFKQCSDALPKGAPILERIVVQHGTDKETVDYANAQGWRVISNGKNNSFSYGNNMAAQIAKGSHLLLVNNDAIVPAASVDALWAKRWHPLLGTFIVNPNGTINHAGMGFDYRNLFPLHYFRGAPIEQVTEDRYVPCVTFACVMVDRKLWEAAKGMDERYYYSFEDVDFCCRALENGIQALMVRDAVVTHRECSTRSPQDLDPKNWEIFHKQWILTKRLPDALGLIV